MLVGGLKVYIIKMSLYDSIADLVNTLAKNVLWYITQKRYKREVLEYLLPLKPVPDQFEMQEMCVGHPWVLKFVSDEYKTQEMCKRVNVYQARLF